MNHFNRKSLALSLSLALAASFGFAQDNVAAADMAPADAATQAAATPKPLEIPDPVATFEGGSISKSEYNSFIEMMSSQGRAAPTSVDEATQMVQELALQKMLVSVAEKKDLDKKEDFINQMGFIKTSMLAQAAVRDYVDNTPIPEAQLKAEYDKQIASSDKIEYRASHILVDTLDEAKKVLEEMKGGAKFEDLAKKYSKDGSATNGGDLDWFPAQGMVAPFSEAVKSMKKGEVSAAPVQTQFGFHIIRLDDTRETVQPKFEDVKTQLEQMQKSTQLRDYIEKVKADAKIEVKIK